MMILVGCFRKGNCVNKKVLGETVVHSCQLFFCVGRLGLTNTTVGVIMIVVVFLFNFVAAHGWSLGWLCSNDSSLLHKW